MASVQQEIAVEGQNGPAQKNAPGAETPGVIFQKGQYDVRTMVDSVSGTAAATTALATLARAAATLVRALAALVAARAALVGAVAIAARTGTGIAGIATAAGAIHTGQFDHIEFTHVIYSV